MDMVVDKQDQPKAGPQALYVTRFETAATYDKRTITARQSYRFRYDKRQINPEMCVIDTETGEPCLIVTTPFGYKKDAVNGKTVLTYGKLVST
jgi:hypothetical protein